MAAKRRETIVLGGEEFTIQTLPMADLWDIFDWLKGYWDTSGNLITSTEAREYALKILARALHKKPEDVMLMPMDLKEIQESLVAVCRVCGLEAEGTTTAPEALTVANSAATPTDPSAASTPASPLH